MNKRFIDGIFLILFLSNVIVGSLVDQHQRFGPTNGEKVILNGGLAIAEAKGQDDNPFSTSVMGLLDDESNQPSRVVHHNDNSSQHPLGLALEDCKDKCFYDSVENMISFLRKSIKIYNQRCSIDDKPQIKNLVDIAIKIGKVGAYHGKKIPAHINQVAESLRHERNFGFSNYLVQLADAVRGNHPHKNIRRILKSAISDELDVLIRRSNLPHFLRESIWRLIQTQRVMNKLIERFGENYKGCIPSDWTDVVDIYDLISDPNFKSIIPNKHYDCKIVGNEITVRPEDFENGGIAISFFGSENLIELNGRPRNVFNGYVNGARFYDYTLIPGDKSVLHRITIGKEIFVIDSESNCADYYFVLLTIQKNCESYLVSVTSRFLAGNKRSYEERKVEANQIENTRFYFDTSITFANNVYRNFKYSTEKEVVLMSLSTNLQTLRKLVSAAHCKKQCAYSVAGRCEKCYKDQIVSNGKCVHNCPTNTFLNHYKKCEPCHTNCAQCFGARNGQCTKCVDPFNFHKGRCDPKCPANRYPDSNRVCQKCGQKCVICKDSKTCGQCKPGYYILNGRCVKECGQGYWKDHNPSKCQPCPKGCASCHSPTHCIKCDAHYYLKHGKECVNNCGKEYFQNENSRTCDCCPDNCDVCSNKDKCEKCSSGFLLTPSKTCTKKCTTGFVQSNGACVACTDRNCDVCKAENLGFCTKCTNKKFLKNGKCVEECGEGFYSDDQRNCVKCEDDHCKVCNENKCIQCEGRRVLFENRKCLQECYPGYIEVKGKCERCNNPHNCRRCREDNLDICTECYHPNVFYNGKCLKNCPVKTYLHQGECKPCIKGCDKCHNNNSCDVCSKDWFLERNICVDCCKEGSIEINGVCEKCQVRNCDFCHANSVDTCSRCIKGYFHYNNQCIKQCPHGTFPNANNECKQCKKHCGECTNEKNCKKCNLGFFLQGDDCVSVCDDGSIPVNGVCECCKNSKCKKCTENLTSCTECEVGEFLFEGECYKLCPHGTYVDKNQCKPCRKPCKECYDQDRCQTCITGFFLTDSHKCTDSCPEGTAQVSGKCVNCQVRHCDKCQSNNLNICINCKPGYVRLGDNCVPRCPNGFFNNNGVCKPCLSGCRVCNDQHTCVDCNDDLFLKGNNQCVKKCGNGWIKNNRKCKECSHKCRKCQVNNSGICTRCYYPYFLVNGDCVARCPSTSWANRLTRSCDSCPIANCEKCKGGKTCTRCKLGFVLENNKCIVPPCSVGFTLNPHNQNCERCELDNCAKCCWDNKKQCEECKSGFWLYPFNNERCVNNCLVGSFKNYRTKECEKCSKNCNVCSDANNCVECSVGTYLFNGRCRKRCPTGHTFVDGKCTPCETSQCKTCHNVKVCDECRHPFFLNDNCCDKTCPKGKYPMKGKCENCGLYCEDCLDNRNCHKCVEGKFLLNGKCTDQCPAGSVSSYGKCVKCKTGPYCSKCSHDDVTKCVECSKGTILRNNECIESCGLRFFSRNKKCHPCSTKCLVCAHENKCLKCEKGSFIFHGRCVNECEAGWYSSNEKCQRCRRAHCKKCDFNGNCQQCENNYLIENGHCVPNCSQGWFSSNNVNCKKCEKGCLQCSTQTTCKVCKHGLYLENGKCVEKCCEGYATVGNTCVPCGSDCEKCSTRNTKDCHKCFPGFFIHEHRCVDCCPAGTYLNKKHQKCKPCFKNCAVCHNARTCEKCDQPFRVNPDSKSCVHNCPDGFMRGDVRCVPCKVDKCKICNKDVNKCETCRLPYLLIGNSCVEKCPTTGFYRNHRGSKCKECPVECDSCVSRNVCKTCRPGFYIKNGKCVNNCGSGFSPENGQCVPCKDHWCDLCTHHGNTCEKCVNGKFLYRNKCEDECCEGTFNYRGTCKDCSKHCSVCSNKDSCKVCDKGYLLQNGKCQERCDKYYVERNGKCVRCTNSKCVDCDNNNLNICRICDENSSLFNHQCVNDCGVGFFSYVVSPKNHVCKPCSDRCDKCVNQNACQTCSNNAYLKALKCVTDCGDRWTNHQGKCEKCGDYCLKCDSVQPTRCTKCDRNTYLKNGQCVKDCGANFYNSPSGICIPCSDKNCRTCSPHDKCQVCHDNWFLLKNSCVKPCPTGFVSNNKGECVQCKPAHCDKCNPENLDKCTKCKSSYLLQDNATCDTECCDGFFNLNNERCAPCSKDCEECTNGLRCTKCRKGQKLDSEGRCVDKCKNGQTTLKGKCVPCVDKLCVRCKREAPEICVRCPVGLFIHKDKCIKKCPHGHYPLANTCHPCNKDCKECDEKQCKKCVKPKVLHNGSCITECFPGFVRVNGICLKCKNPRANKCDKNTKKPIECKDNYYLYLEECLDHCPAGTYADTDKKCHSCGNDCLKCANLTQCQKCNKFMLYKGECIEKCPQKTVNVIGKCVDCKQKTCNKCSVSDPGHCQKCEDKLFNYKGECVSTCPEGFWENIDSYDCEECDEKCSDCENRNTCKKCTEPFLLSDGKCVQECKEGQVRQGRNCVKCNDKNCKTCLARDLNTCIHCKNGYLYKGKCVPQCPENFRGDLVSRRCVPCSKYCKNCDKEKCLVCQNGFYKAISNPKYCINCSLPGRMLINVHGEKHCGECKVRDCIKCVEGNQNKCDVCHISMVNINGQCHNSCPKGTYRQGQSCIPCSVNCLRCSAEDQCHDCKSPSILSKGYCVNECKLGWVSVDGVCKKCKQDNCEKCLSHKRGHCTKCDKNSFILDNTCYHKCPVDTFPLNGECRRCKENCAICDKDRCIKCDSPFVLKDNNCIHDCGQGFANVNGECRPCHDRNCQVCQTEDHCDKCEAGFFFSQSGKCTRDCGKGYFKNVFNNKCEKCVEGCEKCSNEKICEVCEKGLMLLGGECVENCPRGYSKSLNGCVKCEDGDCDKCVDGEPSKCVKCNIHILSDYKCVEKCPRGQYNHLGRCLNCDKKCDKCINENHCTRCKPEFVLNNGNCDSKCSEGKVSLNGKCVHCSDQNCIHCSQNVNTCIDCKIPYVLYDDQCRTQCPGGKFVSRNRSCEDCQKGCQVCQNRDSCVTCEEGWFKLNGECTKVCPPRTFAECGQRVCAKCHESCEECNSVDNTNCTKCSRGYFLNEKACVTAQNCRSGTYGDVFTNKCQRCKLPFCQECSSRDSCRKCIRGFSLNNNGQCVEAKSYVSVINNNPSLFSETTFKLFRPSEIKSFNTVLKGTGIGSDAITYTFWIRRVTISEVNTPIFNVVSPNNGKNVKFSVVKTPQGDKCQVKVGASKFIFNGCNYHELSRWNHFAVVLSRSETVGHVTVYRKIGGVVKNTFNIRLNENFVTKESTLFFNGEGHSGYHHGGAFELAGFNIYDYRLNEEEVEETCEVLPAQCDFTCTECTDRCYTCEGGVKPINGKCASAYISIKSSLQKFNKRQTVPLRTKISKRLDTRTFAFSTWFYLYDIVDEEIGSFEYIYSFEEKIVGAVVQNKQLAIQSGKDINLTGWNLVAKKWYFLLVTVKDKIIHVRLADRSNLNLSKEIECDNSSQLLTEDAIFTTGNNKNFFKGSQYEIKLYIDSIPQTKEEFINVKKTIPCPKNCLKCNGALKCKICNKGFSISKGECAVEGLDIPNVVINKVSIWNKEDLTVKVPTVYSSNNKYTFSVWYRKKIHSHSTLNSRPFNIISIKTHQKNLQPLVSEHLINNYSSQYNVPTSAPQDHPLTWIHNYTNEVYKHIHVLVSVNKNKKRISVEIKDGNSATKRTTRTLSGDIESFIIGDDQGEEINTEFTNGFFYPRVYSYTLNKVIREKTQPKDCDPGCEKCDYLTGLCQLCKVGSTKPNGQLICGNFLSGFKSAFLYNIRDLTNSRPDRFTAFLNKNFNRDVNSLEYSVIGYFRIYDLKHVSSRPNKNFPIFKLANRFSPKFKSPSNDLLTFGVKESKRSNKPEFRFHYSSLDKTRKHIVDLEVESDDWVLVYATINVLKKRIDYSFVVERTGKRYNGEIKLQNFPEKLQEKATLTLFGADFTEDDYINGQVYQFYMSPNLRWTPALIDRYRKAFPVQKDPICANCSKCIHDGNANQSICLKCNQGFELLNGNCSSKIRTQYRIIGDAHTRRFNRPTNDVVVPHINGKRGSIIFHFRRNFIPAKENNRDILKAGNLLVSLHNNQGGAAHINVHIYGNNHPISLNKIDEDLNEDYDWYTIIINYSEHSIHTLVEHNKKIINSKKLQLTTPIDLGDKISFDDLEEEIEISTPHIIYNVNVRTALFKHTNHCSIDCNACMNAKCVDCQYGFRRDGTCKNKPINIPAFELTPKSHYSNIFRLDSTLSKLRPLRSRDWTLYFNFRTKINDFSRLGEKALFRVINHNCDSTPQGVRIADEIFSVNFHTQNRFFIKNSNRFYHSRVHSPKGFETDSFSSKPTHTQYFVAISYSGCDNEFTVVIYNSKSSFIKNTFKFEGSAENINLQTNLVFGDDLEDIIFSEVYFIYEYALHKDKLLKIAEEQNKPFQNACVSGSSFKCHQCDNSSKLSKGLCAPTNGATAWLLKTIESVQDHVEHGTLCSEKHFPVDNSFTFNFWYRRTSYSSDPFGVAVINLHNGNKEREFIKIHSQENNLHATLISDNGRVANQVKINEVYKKDDGLGWIYVTVSVDIRENILNLFIFNNKSKLNKHESNDSRDQCDVYFNDKSYLTIDAGFKVSPLSKSYGFDISSITHFRNFLTTGTSTIERYRTQLPRSCSCKTNCDSKGLCPVKNSFNKEILVGDIYTENKALSGQTGPAVWGKLPLYRQFKDYIQGCEASQFWNDYFVGFDLDVNQLYTSNYKTNSQFLINIHNFNTEESDCKLYSDVINDNFVKFGLIAVENREESLRFYVGGNKPNNYVRTTDFTFKKNSFRSKSRIVVQIHVDSRNKRAKVTLIIDDLKTFFDLSLEYSPESLKLTSNIYNHPSVSNFRVNVHNPRFNYDTYFNYVQAGHRKTHFNSKICGGKCHKCAAGAKTFICQKCHKGYALIGHTCVKSFN